MRTRPVVLPAVTGLLALAVAAGPAPALDAPTAAAPATPSTVTSDRPPDFTTLSSSEAVTADGGRGDVTVQVDVPEGAQITDVVVGVGFGKVSAPDCQSASDGGKAFTEELGYSLTSPAGTTVGLIDYGTFTSDAAIDSVFVALDDEAPAALPTTPRVGRYRPSEPLSGFDGEDPSGTWQLTALDNRAGDPLCHREFSMTIDYDFACLNAFSRVQKASRALDRANERLRNARKSGDRRRIAKATAARQRTRGRLDTANADLIAACGGLGRSGR